MILKKTFYKEIIYFFQFSLNRVTWTFVEFYVIAAKLVDRKKYRIVKIVLYHSIFGINVNIIIVYIIFTFQESRVF